LEARINIVTLGVDDVQASAAFYERLGFVRSSVSQEQIVFIQLGPLVLALFGRDALAHDAGLPPRGRGYGGFTLAQNLASKEAVDAAYAAAIAAGGEPLMPPADAFWGGYTSYFADPDGHPWELAWNPYFEQDANGFVTLPR
jgi:hypothetical protein